MIDRMGIAQDYNRHVKRPLPPSLTGFPGEAEIRYFVKATAQRAAFYKENFRTVGISCRLSTPTLNVRDRK